MLFVFPLKQNIYVFTAYYPLIIMKNPAVLGFYGESGSGKTSLLVKLIKRLSKEGYKIAVVKITDKKIGVDTKGKDTWEYSKSGAKLTILSSPIETDFMIKQTKSINKILKQINNFGSYDFVFIEGAHDKKTKKIRLGNIKKRGNTILSYKGDFDSLMRFIKKRRM
jgi:molybdopterin-guanine dinucleotide biosynthesis protein MobB